MESQTVDAENTLHSPPGKNIPISAPARTQMEAKGPFKHGLLPYSCRPALTSPLGAWPSEDPQNSSAGPSKYGSRERAKPTSKCHSPKQRHVGAWPRQPPLLSVGSSSQEDLALSSDSDPQIGGGGEGGG